RRTRNVCLRRATMFRALKTPGSCGRAPLAAMRSSCSLFSCRTDRRDRMAQFQKIDLDFSQAETEFAEFRTFLQDNATFSERDVVAQLKQRRHLSCLIAATPTGVKRADVFKFEFQIQGVPASPRNAGTRNQPGSIKNLSTMPGLNLLGQCRISKTP